LGSKYEFFHSLYEDLLFTVCVLWNHVPEEITIPSEKNVSLSFLMVVDGNFSKAKAEMIDGKLKKNKIRI
jgi:hypothetical protein